MSAESRRVTKTEAWADWERLVVNGIYPLRRFLGGSDHSAVFLTECKAENLPNAAIKFVPADPVQAEAQLVQWGTAATLSHPHLVRLFDVGRCQVGGRGFLFVVMEHADQTLGQILPKRALSPEEVRELLPPTLDALAFLHRNYLAHGQLKPSNLLVVNDQLKLASDTVRPIGNSTISVARTSVYDPPELREDGNSAAGDVWGLGITLVEALTQRAPAWGEDRSETASLLTTIPPPFVDTVLRCLSRAPSNRPTVIELEAQYSLPQSQAPVISAPDQPVVDEIAPDTDSAERSYRGPLWVAAIAVALLISLAVWVGLPPFQRATDFQQAAPADGGTGDGGTSQGDLRSVETRPAAATDPSPPESADSSTAAPAAAAMAPTAPAAPVPAARSAQPNPEPPPRPVASSSVASPPVASTPVALASVAQRAGSVAPQPDKPSVPQADAASGALHEEMPDIPRAIRERIRGHIGVTVRVLVDPSGSVVGEFMENAGPSRYFARMAGDAAGKWEFAPAEGVGSRVWLLKFEFTSDSATVHITNAR